LRDNPDLVDYLRNKDLKDIVKFYSKSIEDLAMQFVANEESLSEEEHQRLLCEINPAGRSILENGLSPDHPFLKEITAKYSVPVKKHKYRALAPNQNYSTKKVERDHYDLHILL
jgi:hypothetical protein